MHDKQVKHVKKHNIDNYAGLTLIFTEWIIVFIFFIINKDITVSGAFYIATNAMQIHSCPDALSQHL